MVLARAKRFQLHGALQSTVVLLNLGLILCIMLPSFHHQILPSISSSWKDSGIAIALLHSLVGAVAWLVAFYVVLVAGTPVIPRKLRFSNYRRWVWMAFVLWWAVFLLGCAVYYCWYVSPPEVSAQPADQKQTGTVTITNFAWTFNDPGTYRYYCNFHATKGGQNMSGEIVVK